VVLAWRLLDEVFNLIQMDNVCKPAALGEDGDVFRKGQNSVDHRSVVAWSPVSRDFQ